MIISVIIATVGRAKHTCAALGWLARQSRLPDEVIIVGSEPADVDGVQSAGAFPVRVLTCAKGLTRQRNDGLDHLRADSGLVIFFDDDFLPAPDYLRTAEAMFESEPDLVGATGRLIRDGVHGPGISFGEAIALIDRDRAPDPPAVLPRRGLYGCNMVIRRAVIGNLRFDHRLPLYGWQEDVDFTYQLRGFGRLTCDERLAGVHLGVKSGRTSGRRFGYSQIANPIYLLRKQTIPRDRAFKIMWRNVASNIVRGVLPEPHIDRRGRLVGNAIAFRDLAFGRLAPERMLEL